MFKHILIPINTSDPVTWEKPLETGIYLARSCGATLHLMTVVPGFDYPTVESFFPVDFEEKAHAKMSQELQAFVDKHIPDDVTSQTVVSVGSIYEQILKTVEDLKCDLIIMTRKGGPRRRFLMGGNTEKVIHHSKTAVLVLE